MPGDLHYGAEPAACARARARARARACAHACACACACACARARAYTSSALAHRAAGAWPATAAGKSHLDSLLGLELALEGSRGGAGRRLRAVRSSQHAFLRVCDGVAASEGFTFYSPIMSMMLARCDLQCAAARQLPTLMRGAAL